ncbi:MAG: HAMP domain-containing sensor histidine kinase [Clostridia bacterium]|nr:HAMP domain-containing sensor histidine kinase [Clostridia bacterium]
MATKLKKSKLYSGKTKAAAVIAILLSAFITCYSLVYIVDMRYESGLNYNSYFDTDTFYAQYSQLVRSVVNTKLVFKSEENIKAGNALNEDKLIYNFALDSGLGEYAVYKATGEETQVKFANPEDQAYFDERYNDYREQAIQDQLYEYDDAVKELERYTDFYYCLVNTRTKSEISNCDARTISELSVNSYLDGRYTKGKAVYDTEYYYTYSDDGKLMNYFYYDNYLDSVTRLLLNNGYTLYVGIDDNVEEGDGVFAKQYQAFESRRANAPRAVMSAAVFGIIMISGIIYLVIVAGKTSKNSQVTLLAIDYVFNDIGTALFIAAAFLSYIAAVRMVEAISYVGTEWISILKGLICLLFMVDTVILINYVTSISRQAKKKVVFSNTLIGKFLRLIASFFKEKTFRIWIIICLIMFAFINCVLSAVAVMSNSVIPEIIIVIFDAAGVFFTARAMQSITKIMVAVKETSEGNFDKKVNPDDISPSLKNFATDVSNMQNGLKQAVGRAVKGEKMKTELITNVSHDLKTPLTSIITYVDLLKREELNNEKAENYVAILDEKTNRLKQLIEDLVEASKASSGNLAVSKNKINLKELIEQSLGEFEERIEASELEFKMNAPEDVYIYADGKHMWRIAENLITNALKYAMPKTRVFIDITKSETEGIFTIKNVSVIPIDNVDLKSLTERFVRGDASRTTEGAGLGLSITQSLSEIQGGRLEITADGDVFKATVRIPLYTES